MPPDTKTRERFLARRDFDDPTFVRELLRLTQRYIGELYADGAPARLVAASQRVHHTVCQNLSVAVGDRNVLEVPDCTFPERAMIPVSDGVTALLPLDTLENKALYLTFTLDALAKHLGQRRRADDAKHLAALAVQIRRTKRERPDADLCGND